MLTSSDTFNGAARFQTTDPLAQLSRVFYDRLNRFQLSHVCNALGLKHKAGEKHEILVRLIDMALEMRRTSMPKVEAACRVVLTDEANKIAESRRDIDAEDDPFGGIFETPAVAPAPAPLPTTDAVLAFALLKIADKRNALKELGVRFAITDDGTALLAKWREVTGN